RRGAAQPEALVPQRLGEDAPGLEVRRLAVDPAHGLSEGFKGAACAYVAVRMTNQPSDRCLLQHDVVRADHLTPALYLVLDEGGRFGRRAAVRLDVERAEFLLHVGHLQHLDRRLGDLLLQLRTELGRSDHAYQAPDSRSGSPASATVGTSGIADARALSVTASTLSLPSR